MKKLLFTLTGLLLCGIVHGQVFTAPTISVTDSTTSYITVTLSDTTGFAASVDSLTFVFTTTDDDSAGGGALEIALEDSVALSYNLTIAPGTLGYLIARIDSANAGGKLYSNRDTTRVEFPQELNVRSNFVQLYDATSWNGSGTISPAYTTVLTMDSTAAVAGTGSSDSTMWFQSAPYIGIHYEFSSGDSVAATFYAMGGRVPGGELAPQVAVLDSEQVTTAIGDISFDIPIGTGQVYIRATAYIAHERDSDLSLWLRSHWFSNPTTR